MTDEKFCEILIEMAEPLNLKAERAMTITERVERESRYNEARRKVGIKPRCSGIALIGWISNGTS